MEDHWKFREGVAKAKFFKGKYDAKLEIFTNRSLQLNMASIAVGFKI